MGCRNFSLKSKRLIVKGAQQKEHGRRHARGAIDVNPQLGGHGGSDRLETGQLDSQNAQDIVFLFVVMFVGVWRFL